MIIVEFPNLDSMSPFGIWVETVVDHFFLVYFCELAEDCTFHNLIIRYYRIWCMLLRAPENTSLDISWIWDILCLSRQKRARIRGDENKQLRTRECWLFCCLQGQTAEERLQPATVRTYNWCAFPAGRQKQMTPLKTSLQLHTHMHVYMCFALFCWLRGTAFGTMVTHLSMQPGQICEKHRIISSVCLDRKQFDHGFSAPLK